MCNRGTRRVWHALATLALLGVLGLPGGVLASPGCQYLNGQSGTLASNQVLVANNQPVNQGDQVTLTTSGGAMQYAGTFIFIVDYGGAVSGTESGSGAATDVMANNGSSAITYRITCASVAPGVLAVSPSAAAPGQTVTILGSGFYGTDEVTFGGTPVSSFTVNSGNSITATVPNGSGVVPVTVVTDAGTATQGSFTFQAPTANPLSASVAFDSGTAPIALNVTGNPSSVAVASAPLHGVAVASGTSITYKPSSGYAGPDSFSYTASSAAGTSGPATVSITVNAPTLSLSPTSLPNAVAESSYSQTLSTSGGTAPYTYAVAAGALPPGMSLGVSTGVLSGAATAAGTFSFSIRATDSSSGPTAPFSVTQSYTLTINAPGITITPASLLSAQQGTAYNQQLTAGGGSGTYSFSAHGGLPGGLTLSSSGLLSGTPTANGSFNMTVVATDSGGFTGSQTYTLAVATPSAPTASAKSASTAYNTPASINLSTSIAGVDITGVTLSGQPSHGTVTISGETATYTPSPTFYGGSDSFSYTATNPGGTSSPATVTITVGQVAVPTVAAKSATTPYNTATSINLANAISGTDVTGVNIAGNPMHGTLNVAGETITYTPSATFYGGTDSFSYTATNPGGTSSPATVTITVGQIAVPTVAAKSATTPYNTATSINLANAISGTDVTGVNIAGNPMHGTLNVAGETITYTPSATFYGGTDSFSYTVTNPGGTSSPATVTITVGEVAAPTVAAKSVATPYDTATTINLASAISGTDVTGVAIATTPSHGTVNVSGETVTYTPSATFYGGTDTFTYTATNPGGSSSPATVTITVTPLGTPVAAALAVATTTGTPLLIEASAQAASPQPLTGLNVATQPAHGTATASGEQIIYTPASGFVGTDTFTYQLGNHFGTSTPGVITVTVTAAGRAAGLSRTVTTQPGSPVAVNLAGMGSGTYVSSALLGLSPADAGNATLSQPATLSFTPASNFHGLVQITAALIASNGVTQTVDVLVLVSSQPDPSRNQDVLGLVNAQTMQAERFAQNQLSNIQNRLDSLHDGNGASRFDHSLSVSLDGKPLSAPSYTASPAMPRPNEGLADMRPGIGASDSGAGESSSPHASSQSNTHPADKSSSGLGAWVNGVANFGSFDAYRQAAGFDADNIAVSAGVDQRIGERALMGFSVGYNHDNSEINHQGTRSVAQGYSAAFYGSYQPAAHVYLDAVAGGGGLRFDSNRPAVDSATDLTGHRNGSQWFASLTAGYEYQAGTWMTSPYARFAWSLSSLNGFSERGDVAEALTYGTQTVRTAQAVAGVRTSGKLPWRDGWLIPHARLEIGHDFQGTSNTALSYAFIPSAGSWSVLTNPYSTNGTSLQAGFGGDWQLPSDLLITTEYEYLLMPHAHDQSIRVGVHKQF